MSICARSMDTIPHVVENLKADSNFVGINSFIVTWNYPLNYNSPELSYIVSVTNHLDTKIYQNFLYLTGLEECTKYRVQVTAESETSILGMSDNISVTTAPGLPPPPQNVHFMYNVSDGLSLSWDMPSIACSRQTINYFIVKWSCNGFQQEDTIDVATSNFSISVTLKSNVTFGLCVAAVQSCDNLVICGPFSNPISVEVTNLPPPQPECFVYADLITSDVVSFLFPSPFLSSDLQIVWSLNNTNSDTVTNGTYKYTSRPPHNVIDLYTESDATYEFELHACNVYACGSSCTLNFSTSVSFCLLVFSHKLILRS